MKSVKSLNPVGPRVLIQPDTLEEVSAGGIVLHSKELEKERWAMVTGTVIAIGHSCWKDQPGGIPWCSEGDRIIYQKNSGMRIWDPKIGKFREDILLLNDLDVVAVITEEE